MGPMLLGEHRHSSRYSSSSCGTASTSYRVRVLRWLPMLFITGESSSILRGPLHKAKSFLMLALFDFWATKVMLDTGL